MTQALKPLSLKLREEVKAKLELDAEANYSTVTAWVSRLIMAYRAGDQLRTAGGPSPTYSPTKSDETDPVAEPKRPPGRPKEPTSRREQERKDAESVAYAMSFVNKHVETADDRWERLNLKAQEEAGAHHSSLPHDQTLWHKQVEILGRLLREEGLDAHGERLPPGLSANEAWISLTPETRLERIRDAPFMARMLADGKLLPIDEATGEIRPEALEAYERENGFR